MENIQNAIEVRNMSKDFKLVFDKPTTLKERLVFWNREKPKWHHVLKNINYLCTLVRSWMASAI